MTQGERSPLVCAVVRQGLLFGHRTKHKDPDIDRLPVLKLLCFPVTGSTQGTLAILWLFAKCLSISPVYMKNPSHQYCHSGSALNAGVTHSAGSKALVQAFSPVPAPFSAVPSWAQPVTLGGSAETPSQDPSNQEQGTSSYQP